MKLNLYELLTECVNGSSFISINIETDPRLRKTMPGDRSQRNPHHGNVVKRTDGMNVMVFQNKNTNAYDNMVRRRLDKEGKDPDQFEIQPRVWGSRIPNTCFVEHNGKLYLEVIVLQSGVTYFFKKDGQLIDREDVIGLPNPSNGHQGGLEDKVIIRTIGIDSIRSITIDHKTYTADELYCEVTDEVA